MDDSDVARSDDEAPAGLFRDDDDETAAQQPGLFPEEAQEDNQGDGTQMNTTANLDITGVEKKKRVIKNPQPKLDAERIMGSRGIQCLEEIFKDWEPKGRGHEFDDLEVIMYKMNHWTHRLYPKLPFDDTLDILANRLGNKKIVTTHLKKIRMGMVAPVHVGGGGDEGGQQAQDEADIARYDAEDEPDRVDEAGHLFNQVIGTPAAASPPAPSASARAGPSEEQLERMRRNKEMATRKRRERDEQRRREAEEDQQLHDMEENEPSIAMESVSQRISSQYNLSPQKEKGHVSPAKDHESQDQARGGRVFPMNNRVAPEKDKSSTEAPSSSPLLDNSSNDAENPQKSVANLADGAVSQDENGAETAAAASEWSQEKKDGLDSEKEKGGTNEAEMDGEVLDLDGMMDAMDDQ